MQAGNKSRREWCARWGWDGEAEGEFAALKVEVAQADKGVVVVRLDAPALLVLLLRLLEVHLRLLSDLPPHDHIRQCCRSYA